MTDSQTLFRYFNDRGHADIVRDAGNALRDATLESAVVMSLGTYASAVDGSTDEGGFWGEPYLGLDRGGVFGDRVWSIPATLDRESKLRLAEQHGRAALQWMINDGLARAIEVVATNPQSGVLARTFTITRANGEKYTTLWEQTLAAF